MRSLNGLPSCVGWQPRHQTTESPSWRCLRHRFDQSIANARSVQRGLEDLIFGMLPERRIACVAMRPAHQLDGQVEGLVDRLDPAGPRIGISALSERAPKAAQVRTLQRHLELDATPVSQPKPDA